MQSIKSPSTQRRCGGVERQCGGGAGRSGEEMMLKVTRAIFEGYESERKLKVTRAKVTKEWKSQNWFSILNLEGIGLDLVLNLFFFLVWSITNLLGLGFFGLVSSNLMVWFGQPLFLHTPTLIPCYLKSMYQSVGIFRNARVVFCIHNIAYQGRFAFSDFSLLNLPDQFKSSFDFLDGHVRPVIGRKINWMKAAILEAHLVLTVSPYYAQELVSGPDKGVELDNIIRRTGITGIVNGMDVQEWNPSTDKYITVKYNASSVLEGKALLKETLQAEVGLPVDRNIPLIGFIGRLEEQKGSDILVAAIPQFIRENVQIVALGTGKKEMEKQLQQLETAYPDKAIGVAKFNVPLAHMIIAGADFILVPSRFEPCGLIQLQAMRYGTVPIVASTGGLVDTVKEGFTGFQMGSFNVECDAVDPADVDALAKTVTRALAVYGTQAFTEMIKNCMALDLSWKGPAKKWEEVLLSLGVPGSGPGIDGEEIAPQAKENIAAP